MTSETDKCGISTILPMMSCRERAEAFAKHLNSRLQSLGSQDGTLLNNETSWLSDNDNPVAIVQPKTSDSGGDIYYEFGILESPDSPAEVDVKLETELTKLINKDNNIVPRYNSEEDDNFRKDFKYSSSSDDGPYFETDADDKVLLVNSTDDVDFKLPNLLNENDDLLNENDVCKTDENLNNQKKDDSLSSNLDEKSVPEEKIIILKLPELIVDSVFVADDDDDDEAIEIPRVRRCSSLKTGKTPPGTPGRKKIVRFADVLGLDLADVRTYLDEIPKVPNSAYNDLACVDLSSFSNMSLNSLLGTSSNLTKILLPMFQQPGGQPNFLDKVKIKQVCLENVMVEDPVSFAIKGTVRVRNLDYNKSVHVRYTLDGWKSYSDLQATYVQNSCDGFSDKFTFLLYGNTLSVGQRLEFAIRFHCKGCQYWDNNYGLNYCFQCLPVATNQTSYQQPVDTVDDQFGAAFYYEDQSEETSSSEDSVTNVQEYILRNMTNINKDQDVMKPKRKDMITVVVILIFSILFLYIQKAIYFSK